MAPEGASAPKGVALMPMGLGQLGLPLGPFTLALGLLAPACGGPEPAPPAPVPPGEMPPGMWTDLRFAPGAGELSQAERERLEALGALGYATALEAHEGPTGVLTREPGRAVGPVLYTSGHAAEALMIDDGGSVLHRWGHAFADLPGEEEPPHPTQEPWRRVRVLEDGGLLALHDGVGLARLDRDSNLLWWHRGGEHHDLWVAPDASIWTLTRQPARLPELGPEPVLEDFLTHLSPGGEVLGQVSLLRALLASPHAHLIERVDPSERGDPLHANSLAPVGEALAARLQGVDADAFLLSLRNPSALVVLQPRTERLQAALIGPFVRQHDARPTAEGTVLLFDNMGREGWSRALEWDPAAEAIAWSWEGQEGAPLLSVFCGAAQRLPGGTTLVTESTAGRAYEVDREGRVLWRFESPHRAGEGDRLVGVLYEAQRLPGVPKGLEGALKRR